MREFRRGSLKNEKTYTKTESTFSNISLLIIFYIPYYYICYCCFPNKLQIHTNVPATWSMVDIVLTTFLLTYNSFLVVCEHTCPVKDYRVVFFVVAVVVDGAVLPLSSLL